MKSEAWLKSLRDSVCGLVPAVTVMNADEATVSFSSDLRVVVVHVAGDVAIVAPSFAAGGTIASRLESRVQHLEPTSYRLDAGAADAAAITIAAHLR